MKLPIISLRNCAPAFRLVLLSGLAALGVAMAHAQQHILYYDPNVTGGTALGGSGVWYGSPSWWDGTNDVYWDGNSSVSFQGAPGTVTLNAEVDCGPNSIDASPSFNVHGNFILDLNSNTLNFNDQWGEVGIYTDPGVTFQIVGVQATNPPASDHILNWQGGGVVEFGNGNSLPYSQFGTALFRGIAELDNNPAGAAAFSSYTALQGGSCSGVGRLSADGTLVEMSGNLSYNYGATPTLSVGIGNGTGTLVAGGDLQEDDNTATLSFNIGGVNQGSLTNGYSWLDVNGTITLYAGSIINVQFVNGFLPSENTSFDIITCSNFVFQGGSGISDVKTFLPMVSGLTLSDSIVTNNGQQSLRLSVAFTNDVIINITQQPTNVTVNAGQPATFQVAATLLGPAAATGTLSYQWESNGIPIVGATNTSYTTSPLTAWANQASYNCQFKATSAQGLLQMLSAGAVVTVVEPTPQAVLYLPFNGSLTDHGIGGLAPHNASGQNVYGSAYAGKFGSDVANATCGSDSLSLTGDGSDVDVSNSPDINFNQPFTVSAWIKTTTGGEIWAYSTPNPIAAASGTHCIACFVGSSSPQDGEPAGTVCCDTFWVGANYSTKTVNDGNWHQVVVTATATNAWDIYIDGTLDTVTHNYGYGLANEGANHDAGTWNFTVGATLNYNFPTETGTDNPFTGELDEVAYWREVLTANQIQAIYNLGVNYTVPTLTATKAGSQLTLSWSGTSWVLQQNSSLTNATGWTDVPNGGTSPVTLPIGTGSEFFRLATQ